MTTDPVFDQLISELVRPEIVGGSVDVGDGSYQFLLATGAVFNEELLQARLVETNSSLPDATFAASDDGVWTWDEGQGSDSATATIDFTFGWGDCFVACEGLHDLRAVIPPTGVATVFDLGGDRLPSFLMLDPNTLPP